MIALYSLWNCGNEQNKGGFASIDDMMSCIKLSMLQSAKWFSSVVLVTDSIGQVRAKAYNLPCDIICAFDHIEVKPFYWAMAKLVAMGLMREPFTHIDNDFIFWQDPSAFIKGYDLCFQSVEDFATYDFYNATFNELKQRAPVLYNKFYNPAVPYAYNCGIVSCADKQITREWTVRAVKFLKEADAIPLFSSYRGCFNHLLEQYIIALIVHERSIKINMLLPDMDMGTKLFTHIWGNTKTSPIYMKGIKRKLESMALAA